VLLAVVVIASSWAPIGALRCRSCARASPVPSASRPIRGMILRSP